MSIYEELFSLAGKKALVTGGASGIGRMIATALVRAGADVMIASRKADQCAAVAGELTELANAQGTGGRAEGFAGDVSTEEGVAALAGEVRARTDALHILFNNAGATWGAPLDEFPYHAWVKVLNLNVTGLFMLTRDLLALLEAAGTAQDPARIVNLGSVMGTAALGDGSYSYAASKAAVHHLTRILAKELARRHVTVNAFAPGPFQSRMTAFATGTDEKAARVAAGVPLGRIGMPDDIAAATLYLCGRGGAYVTGAILPLDGGIHVQTREGTLFNQ
ncbi:MAG: 3-oxoacyl-ACP reductase [Alphaproteobacteria bacterium]|nr:MAG: 3-oxoacyl-ACP reductase [Alphaproteobacteria bacterium]